MADLIFEGITVAVILGIVVWLWGKGDAAFKDAVQQLESQGYVVTRSHQRNSGPVTWVWGRYAQPVPLYIRASCRDVLAAAIGRMGVADLTVGHEEFDRKFVVRSLHPKWARAFLTHARCARLLAAGDVEFIVSSIENLLSPEYWPEQAARDQREIWMLRISGIPDSDTLARHVALARELAHDVQAFSAGLEHSPQDLRAGSFEGM